MLMSEVIIKMSIRGRSINLFLMDGTSSGRIKCTLANWTGVAYKIPRIDIDKCKDREELKQSGVYFLFGISEETDKPIVYIGQAGIRKNGEGILNRLVEHKKNPEKDYWTEVIVFTTSNNSFGPTEISYLESRFYKIALEAERYDVNNGNNPTSGNITEEKESEMEEFIDCAKIVMGTLGHKLFDQLIEKSKPTLELERTQEELFLYLKRKSKKSGRIIEANCKQTNEGFVVLKGSMIETIDSETIPHLISKRRKDVNIDKNGILQEDVLFKSPSYAAVFVIGGHANGLNEWRNKEGKTLKEIDKSAL